MGSCVGVSTSQLTSKGLRGCTHVLNRGIAGLGRLVRRVLSVEGVRRIKFDRVRVGQISMDDLVQGRYRSFVPITRRGKVGFAFDSISGPIC